MHRLKIIKLFHFLNKKEKKLTTKHFTILVKSCSYIWWYFCFGLKAKTLALGRMILNNAPNEINNYKLRIKTINWAKLTATIFYLFLKKVKIPLFQ